MKNIFTSAILEYMVDHSEPTLQQEPQAIFPWIERFANKENYSSFSLAVLEACKSFFNEKLSLIQREKLKKMEFAVLVTGSLLRGNARAGSDIDLVLVMDGSKSSIVADEPIIELLHIQELKKFVVDYLEQRYPQLYERLFEVRLANFTKRVEKFLVAKAASPDNYSQDPNYWGNLPPEKRAQYVKENFLSFFVEVSFFDVNSNLEEEAKKVDTDDDLIHGFISLLFSSELQALFGDRNTLRSFLMTKLSDWQEKDPEKFAEFYAALQKGFESFLSFTGKNHFYLDVSQENTQKVAMPSFDQLKKL